MNKQLIAYPIIFALGTAAGTQLNKPIKGAVDPSLKVSCKNEHFNSKDPEIKAYGLKKEQECLKAFDK